LRFLTNAPQAFSFEGNHIGLRIQPRVTERRADFLARLVNRCIFLVVGARHASPLRFAGQGAIWGLTSSVYSLVHGRGTLQCAPTIPGLPGE
jgi:hypothetical protein